VTAMGRIEAAAQQAGYRPATPCLHSPVQGRACPVPRTCHL
jgi:hypothetical protein